MKKTSIILIALIYICAIFLVSFFGLNYKEFNKIVYADSVEVINPTDKITNDEEGNQVKNYIVYPDKTTGLRQFQIEWRIEPAESVTNKKVRFIYDESPYYTIDENGLVSFTKGGVAVTIKIVPDDNSDCFDKITIYSI